MELIDGYVKIIENKGEEPVKKDCKIINFFSWSDGTNTFPVALVMMARGEVHQYPATSVCFKLKHSHTHTLQ